MKTLTLLLLWLVVAAHVSFVVIEMYPWDRPSVFSLVDLKLEPREELKAAPIVLNAGLYNIFLTAGLVWGILKSRHGFAVRVFCLTCAIVAGLFGALTLTPKTVLLQSVPAALALAAVLRTRSIEKQ